jgi:dUTP pyrophosphatase
MQQYYCKYHEREYHYRGNLLNNICLVLRAVKKISVRIINRSSNPLPSYATDGSSGMDIRAQLDEPLVLEPMQRAAVPTGLFIELPEGLEAQIRPRSGLALKNGITCLNTPGTIDSDYRGEIKVILINLSGERQVIHHSERIAQMVVQNVLSVQWQTAFEINESSRGTGGFGHTGKS